MPYFLHIATFVHSLFKSRHQLRLENLALRQQLAMLKPSVKRPQVSPADRLFWILFSKYVDGWRTMLHALHPDTVVRWHREGFKGAPFGIHTFQLTRSGPRRRILEPQINGFY